MNRRQLLRTGLATPFMFAPLSAAGNAKPGDQPILVVVEMSGGNDGLNSVVPISNDAYYQLRPKLGINAGQTLPLDADYGLNKGMLGLHRLWQDGQLAIVHGCGYDRPSFSHFTSMAYWHTGAPHRGSELGWVGRTADVLAPERVPNLLINVASNQSLAVKSARHTPVVFDEPERFARHQWMHAPTDPALNPLKTESAAGNRAFLQDVYRSANTSARDIQAAWQAQTTQADYGIAPMGLPKVAACIKAGLGAQLYYVAFANNAFDTHVQQAALHRRLLSYLCDGVYGFLADLRSAGVSKNVVVLMFSEFGRRAGENANQGTDHGTANVMFMAGDGVRGGHYGSAPDLTQLTELGNVTHTTDFRQVYATALNGWLGVDAAAVLGQPFANLPIFS